MPAAARLTPLAQMTGTGVVVRIVAVVVGVVIVVSVGGFCCD